MLMAAGLVPQAQDPGMALEDLSWNPPYNRLFVRQLWLLQWDEYLPGVRWMG